MPNTNKWEVELDDEFESEDFESFSDDEKDALLIAAKGLARAGPQCGRPLVDTLKGSKHSNMKELRYDSLDGTQVWRAAFAFDPLQKAVVLCAADKQGKSGKNFYKSLIRTADRRFDAHLQRAADKIERAKANKSPGTGKTRQPKSKTGGRRK